MNINCEIFTFNPVEENCCIFWDVNTLDAAIVDCGARTEAEFKKVEQCIDLRGLHLRMVLQTHTHFDHIYGLPRLYEKYGIGPSCHADDLPIYQAAQQMASAFALPIQGNLPPVAEFLNDGQELKLGSIPIRVIHTPGHTPGGICFYLPESKQLFCGDTLFHESVGRTDLPGGDSQTLLESISSRLFKLPYETRVLPGHGDVTTIGWEASNNPYVYNIDFDD